MTRRKTTAGFVLLGILTLVGLTWSLHGWQGHNGDHAYYSAMALQYGGTDYDSSLAQVADYFDYPAWARSLDGGFLNPTVAPLIYPRTVYSLLATIPVKVFGLDGMFVPGILAGLLGTAVIIGLIRQRDRSWVALVPIGLLLSTKLYTEVGFGIYVDALVMTGVALLLRALPLRGPRSRWQVLLCCCIVVVMMMSRQVPLVPLGMVAGGWLWATVARRRARNEWLPFLLAVVGTTLVAWYALSTWAPYDPLPFLRTLSNAQTTPGLIADLPRLVIDSLGHAGKNAVTGDFMLVPLLVLGLIGGWRRRTSPLVGVALGLLGAGVATVALNTLAELRYLTPLVPALALLASDGALQVARWVRPPESADEHLPMQEDQDAPDPDRLGRRTACAGVLVVLGLITASVLVNQPASLAGAPHLKISRDDFGPWPLTAPSGELICAGDNLQVWFRTDDGTLYAVSGTAMAASFRRPRVIELARGQVPYGWGQVRPFLNAGLQLCRQSGGSGSAGARNTQNR